MGTPISGLPAEGTVLTTDIVPLVSGGVTKIATIAEIGTAIGGGGGGAGVDSLAGLTGALTLESTDSTIAITPTGTSIDLTVVGGGGGGGGTFASLSDVDTTTQGAGKFLTLSTASFGRVQQKLSKSLGLSGSESNPSFDQAPKAGNLLVIVIGYSPGQGAVEIPSGYESQGNPNYDTGLLICTKTSVGAADQTPALTPNSTGCSCIMEEWSGAEFFSFAGGTGLTTSGLDVPAGATAFAAFAIDAPATNSGAPAAGWTQELETGGDNYNYGTATVLAEQTFDEATSSVAYTAAATGGGNLSHTVFGTWYLAASAGLKPYVFAPVTAADVVPSEYDSMILSEPGLMYYFPLSDTTTPICLATGRGSIVNGSPTYSATSLIASGDPAITFPTDSDSLGFDRAFATFANTPFSWECFIELPSLPSSNLKFICMENSGTVSGSALYITTAGRLMVEFDDEADLDGGFAFTAGTPYHVVLVFDGGSLTTWVNGVADYIGTNRPLDVGSGGGNPFISGGSITIQKVAFYSVMLTKRRILAHYAQIAANAPSYPLIP
jgi:hypothetical protein